ncbi:CHAT domain-containing protein [Xylaria sp. FL1042]|nr:CHAT domain-containing protein [Xylaria sp. FL1042]
MTIPTGLGGAIADLEEARICYFSTVHHVPSATSIRITAGRQFLSLPRVVQDINQAYVVAKATVDLIPLSTSRSLHHADKQYLLSQAAGIASDAAAIALQSNKGPAHAAELLETGRGVLAGALQDLRTDQSMLKQQYPELARSFTELRQQLDAPAGDQRRRADEQLNHLLGDIRARPGFDRFLLTALGAEMQEAVHQGPIVILNVSKYRCDAILVEPSGFRLIPLLTISRSFTRPPFDGRCPRIWWIPTGPLVGSPLHAAGYHLQRNGRTALDRVVSSYSSSGGRKPQEEDTGRDVVLDEIYAVREIMDRSTEASCVKPRPYKQNLLSALESCEIFHFAGHGGTHPTSPLESQLFPKDWKTDLLTVENLFDTNLSSEMPFLAYLSACGTGKTENKRLADESIHLTSAFQLAGFQNVIGTLWSVDDRVCVNMARATYAGLWEGGMSNEAVSRGPHFIYILNSPPFNKQARKKGQRFFIS